MSPVKDVIARNIRLGIRAPQFPTGMDWFNVDRPLTLEDLKGKVVLLDFWTFCCINCMHVISDLKKLEAKYPNELMVVGVHSAKFDNEKVSENIRRSILRYELKHPVLNDYDMNLWREYAVHSWPTLVLLDTEGRIVLQVSGEGHYAALDEAIAELIRLGDRDRTLNRVSFKLKTEKDGMESEMLRFPGKIRTYPDRLIISDSNHNRILVTDFDGKILETIGDGKEGWRDGNFEETKFNHPQGAALDGDFIYVADTENHLIRRIDLKNKIVETVAGTGKQMLGRIHGGRPLQALTVELSSPWDIVKRGDDFYIAMAGAHQIWIYHPEKQKGKKILPPTVEPFAGSGGENIADGPFKTAAFSQPSGLASDGKDRIYVADSEVSAVRYLDLKEGRVHTLVGTGLFDFGDRDGNFNQALFQHGLGVDVKDGKVYFADTYNDRIKELNLEREKVKSIFGTGKGGYKDGKGSEAQFYEPGGLSVLGDKIYVADTNNHKIRVADMKTGDVITLKITEQKAVSPAPAKERVDETVELPSQTIAQGKPVNLSVGVDLAGKYEFTEGVPLSIRVKSESGEEKWKKSVNEPARNLPVLGKIDLGNEGSGNLNIFLDIYFCEKKDQALCHFKAIKLIQPLEIREGVPSSEVQVKYQVK